MSRQYLFNLLHFTEESSVCNHSVTTRALVKRLVGNFTALLRSPTLRIDNGKKVNVKVAMYPKLCGIIRNENTYKTKLLFNNLVIKRSNFEQAY